MTKDTILLRRILLNQAAIMSALADLIRTTEMNRHLVKMSNEAIDLLKETE